MVSELGLGCCHRVENVAALGSTQYGVVSVDVMGMLYAPGKAGTVGGSVSAKAAHLFHICKQVGASTLVVCADHGHVTEKAFTDWHRQHQRTVEPWAHAASSGLEPLQNWNTAPWQRYMANKQLRGQIVELLFQHLTSRLQQSVSRVCVDKKHPPSLTPVVGVGLPCDCACVGPREMCVACQVGRVAPTN